MVVVTVIYPSGADTKFDFDYYTQKHLPLLMQRWGDSGLQGVEALSASVSLGADETVSLVKKSEVDAVCISVVAPSTVLHARYLCLKLRAALPAQRILVGLWGSTEDLPEASRRVRESGADIVVSTLAEAASEFGKTAQNYVASTAA